MPEELLLIMEYVDQELSALIVRGRNQGYLTYDEINAYLPDEASDPEKIDNLLMALDGRGIAVLDKAPPAPPKPAPLPEQQVELFEAPEDAEQELRPAAVDAPKLSVPPHAPLVRLRHAGHRGNSPPRVPRRVAVRSYH